MFFSASLSSLSSLFEFKQSEESEESEHRKNIILSIRPFPRCKINSNSIIHLLNLKTVRFEPSFEI